MPSVRCEKMLTNDKFVEDIGSANTTTALTASSQTIYGPVTRQEDVLVRAFGGQAYVTKGPGTVAATSANGILVDIGGQVPFRLSAGESVAAINASVA